MKFLSVASLLGFMALAIIGCTPGAHKLEVLQCSLRLGMSFEEVQRVFEKAGVSYGKYPPSGFTRVTLRGDETPVPAYALKSLVEYVGMGPLWIVDVHVVVGFDQSNEAIEITYRKTVDAP